MKKENGITLISLVVTIIVLIILAGVSINLILGQDGIINKTKEAKQNMEYAQIEEQEQLNELYEQMENNSSGIVINSIEKLVEFKKEIADYIESKNVERPETAGDANVYINSFEEVLALASKIDESMAATENDIKEGKAAWVNGKKIIGTGAANTNSTINTNGNEVLLNASSGTNNGTTTTNFTCTSSGVLFVWANRGYTPRSLVIKINDVEVVNYAVVSNTNPLRQVINIKEGDSIEITNTHYSGDEFVGVYYFK